MAPKRKAPEAAAEAAAKPTRKAPAPKAAKKPAAAPRARKASSITTKAKPAAPKRASAKPKAPARARAAPAAAKKRPAATKAAAAAKKPAAAAAAKMPAAAKKPAAAAAKKPAAAAAKRAPAKKTAAAKKPAPKPAAAAKKPAAAAVQLPSDLECFTFGSNPFGALGLGEDVVEKFRPARVALPPPASSSSSGGGGCAQVACGGMHTVALSSDGRVFTWGVNDEGALGRPTAGSAWETEGGGGGGGGGGGEEQEAKGDPYAPGEVRLPAPSAGKVVAVAAGDGVSFALTARGDVWGWGCFKDDASGASGFSPSAKVQRLPALVYSASEGAVGAGGGAAGGPAEPPPAKKAKTASAPPSSASSSSSLGPVVKVACGARHVALLTRGGDVLTFGMAGQGQLGRVASFDQRSAPLLASLLTPAPVAALRSALKKALSAGDAVVDVSCGAYATYAVTQQGRVAAWGLNNAGQLALPPPDASAQGTEQFVWLPRAVPCFGPGAKAGPVAAVAGGEHHALALTKSGGRVLSFGSPTYGMLGRADVDPRAGGAAKHPDPKEVDGEADGLSHAKEGGAVAVAAGTNVSACVTAAGNVYLWGSNVSGQMAKGADDDDCERPTRMRRAKAFGNRRVAAVAFGGQHAALLAGAEPEEGGGGGGDGALSPA